MEYTCTRNEMIVPTRSIAQESGTRGRTVRTAPAGTSWKMPMDTMADAAIAAAASGPVHCFSQRFPKHAFTKNAARGNAGISQTFWITPPSPPDLRASHADSSGLVGLARPGIARSRSFSSLQLVDLVHVHRRAIAIRGEHDRPADRDLRRGDDEDEDDEDAPALVQRIAGRA